MSQSSPTIRAKRNLNRPMLVGVMLILAGTGVLLWLTGAFDHEPTYENKRVTTWINELGFTQLGDPNPTLYALIQMGPGAVPYLAHRLRWRDSNKYYVALYAKVPQPARRLLPRPHTEQDRWLAAWSLREFGLLAQRAMPD